MKTIEALRYKQRLDALFKQVSSLNADPELQSHWARYLCVLTSGFLETLICAIYSELCHKSAAPFVANFVQSSLKDFQNPKMGKILELTRAFNPAWADEIEKATSDKLKASIDGVVANRNLIAHGRDVGITYTRIKDYFGDAVEVINLIEKICGV